MTAPRGLTSPTGLRPGDHVCWTFADDADLAEAVVSYLDEGRRRDEQLLLIGASRPALLTACAALPDRDELLAGGRLDLQTTGDAYAGGSGLAPLEQVERYRAAVQEALGSGRTGLRVAADVTALIRDGRSGRRRLHAYEQLADVLMGAVPMTAVCLYDESVGAEELGPVAVLHPLQHLGDRQPQTHLSGRGPRLSLHGEVDLTEAEHVRTALVDVAGDGSGELVLDLSDLDFLDVAGGRALYGARRDLAARGIRLRLAGAPRHVRRCLGLFDLAVEPA
ncbi:MEDS domain-containing protein [Geodermatophilus tzadiensis]|uniref:MEDS domain-containing protein n=1 Tax=Geodermatophilus tzadiensis TaxID=1137988 RepID=UPI000D06AB5F|nr:MEDS domain-containing protein [Geodermatophilus tzadiensis]